MKQKIAFIVGGLLVVGMLLSVSVEARHRVSKKTNKFLRAQQVENFFPYEETLPTAETINPSTSYMRTVTPVAQESAPVEVLTVGKLNAQLIRVNDNVGIGTVTPRYKLEVMGSSPFAQSIYSSARNDSATRIGLKNSKQE